MVHALASETLKLTKASEKTKQLSEKQRTPKMMVYPGRRKRIGNGLSRGWVRTS
jgi:hypothetical protein